MLLKTFDAPARYIENFTWLFILQVFQKTQVYLSFISLLSQLLLNRQELLILHADIGVWSPINPLLIVAANIDPSLLISVL